MTVKQPRWDGDDRGHGVAGARYLSSGARELVAALEQAAWVAEQPELHLRPHVEAWCERDKRLALLHAHSDPRGAYVLDFEWRAGPCSVGEIRSAVFCLVGEFAESATYVRQRRAAGDDPSLRLQFEVGTGELAPDARFAPHGHAVMINVTAQGR